MAGIDKGIFQRISKHKKIKPNYKNEQVIRQTISNIKRKNAGLTSNAAAQIFADMHKVSVYRYLDDKDKDSLSKYIPKSSNQNSNTNNSKKGKVKGSFDIALIGEIEAPGISNQLAKDAKKMASVYPIIYVFENSVRELIQKIMESKHGKDWWKKATISTKIKDKVKIRKKNEKKNKWHGQRGAHEIFYTDIEELTSIIENNWEDFKKYLPKQHWVKTMIEIIGTSRNVIAHNNPLSVDDISALKVHFKQWIKQIKDIEIE